MLTTIDKAIAGGVVSFLANWLLVRFHITLPADVQVALTGLLVSLAVWVTPNIEQALEPKAPVAVPPPTAKGP